MSYSTQQLKELAHTDLQELLRIINHHYKIDIKTVALAIDVLGEEIKDETVVLPVIRRLLKHIHVLIRESAIICVMTFYADRPPPPDIVDRLKIIAQNDPSNDLRDLAKDSLRSFS